MTLAEIKAKVALLTKAERDELGAYLRAEELTQSAEWRAKITERARQLERGEGVPIERVERQSSSPRSA